MGKSRFTPYANEADVLNIGSLAIENRVDRVSLHGAVDLTRDQHGLARARALHELLGAVLQQLESQTLPEVLPPPKTKKVANPFE
jgi:hypothetical protein